MGRTKKSSEINVGKRGDKAPTAPEHNTPRKTSASDKSNSAGASGSRAGSAASTPQKSPAGAGARRPSAGVEPRKVSDSIQQLNPAAMRLVRDSYNLLDSDGSGCVSRQALSDMMVSLGLGADSNRLDEMMDRLGGGTDFSFANYLVAMSPLLRDLPTSDDLEAMFKAFEKDGVIDISALRQALEQQGMSSEDIDGLMAKFGKRSGMKPTFDSKAFVSVMGV